MVYSIRVDSLYYERSFLLGSTWDLCIMTTGCLIAKTLISSAENSMLDLFVEGLWTLNLIQLKALLSLQLLFVQCF